MVFLLAPHVASSKFLFSILKLYMASEFDIDKNDLYEILSKKGINNLFHANTISTSITFLNEKNLLSRKYVEDNNLFQTPQYTDNKDKRYGIWDDIFLDAIDIHTEFRRPNNYGPFLFSFDLDILKSDLVKTIRITKVNPSKWDKYPLENDRYYSDLNQFDDNYRKGNKLKDVGSMFILKDINGKLPLLPYSNRFILDNPNLVVNYNNEKKVLADILTEKIDSILLANNFGDVTKELRHKHNFFNCTCWPKYNSFLLYNFSELKRLFHPTPNK